MLNKKAQFAENVDLIIGVILFVAGIVLFSIFSNYTEATTEDQRFEFSANFEGETQNLDVINFISDQENLEFFTYFEESKDSYLTQDLIFNNIFNHKCTDTLKEQFQEKIIVDLWSIELSDDGNSLFICTSDNYFIDETIFSETDFTETITIPTSDPQKSLTLELKI